MCIFIQHPIINTLLPALAAITDTSLFGYVLTGFAHLGTAIFFQARSDLTVSICEQQFLSLTTDSQQDLGLDFNWDILNSESF